MLGADVVVAHQTSFFDRKFEHLFSFRGEGDFPHHQGVEATWEVALNFLLELLEIDTQLLQDGDGDAATVLQYSQQDMLGPEILMMIALGLFPRQDNDPSRSLRESLEHASIPPQQGNSSPSISRTVRS